MLSKTHRASFSEGVLLPHRGHPRQVSSDAFDFGEVGAEEGGGGYVGEVREGSAKDRGGEHQRQLKKRVEELPQRIQGPSLIHH